MKILGVDIETTSLDVNEAEIIELGAVLWDTERKCPLKIYSEFIDISPRIIDSTTQQITGILPDDLKRWGKPLSVVLKDFLALENMSDAIVAHNAFRFDLRVIDNLARREGVNTPSKPVIDTIYDLPISDKIRTRALKFLAAEHGFLNPFSHRALFDVLTMLKIMSFYDFEEIWKISSSDFVRVEAKVNYEARSSASSLGFSWNPNAKAWSKVMRRAIAEKTVFPFPTEMSVIELLAT